MEIFTGVLVGIGTAVGLVTLFFFFAILEALPRKNTEEESNSIKGKEEV